MARGNVQVLWLLPWGEEEDGRHLPWTMMSLVVINIAVFLAMPAIGSDEQRAWIEQWGLVPAHPQLVDFVSSCFLHADWMHLIGNMFMLILLGDNVEDVFGPLGFLLLYFAGGLLGDAVFVFGNPGMEVPGIGASGCIATIAGAYAVLFATRTIDLKLMLMLLPIASIRVPAILVLVLWFAMDIYLTMDGHGALAGGGGVNYVVHGIGFLVGLMAAVGARMFGAMVRFEAHREGHRYFGYLPWNVGRDRLPRWRR